MCSSGTRVTAQRATHAPLLARRAGVPSGSSGRRPVVCKGRRMAERVNVDNFVRAETNRMFAGLDADAGAVNGWFHHRSPASVDHQTVIRMNRDTLYSTALVDISDGATLTVPAHGDRYVSVMIVNQDHYINEIFHDPGVYELSVDRHHTP